MKYILLAALLLTGCQKTKKEYSQLFEPMFEKTGILFKNRMEGTPVVFKNELIYVVSNRFDALGIEIYSNDTLINSFITGTEYASAFVDNDELYIFSTRNNKQIEMIKTSDLETFTQPVVVFTGYSLFNSSVAKTDSGFIMAYEAASPNYYNTRFATSNDLVNWTDTKLDLDASRYTACPTVKFSNGFYYVFYLVAVDQEASFFATFVSRSKDLINWEHGPGIAAASKDEGTNNSDLDLIEVNGKVFFQYADGDQKSPIVNIRGGVFNGSLDQFLESLFKD